MDEDLVAFLLCIIIYYKALGQDQNMRFRGELLIGLRILRVAWCLSLINSLFRGRVPSFYSASGIESIF